MRKIDFSQIKTYPIAKRVNRVTMKDLIQPGSDKSPGTFADLEEVAERILTARMQGKPVIWMIGAHVIKCGLSPLIIDLMEKGFITHMAGNGAVSIHDFELSMIGETSEDVAQGLEDGSFGMAEETGAWMSEAVRLGVRNGLGYGQSIGKFIDEHPQRFPHRQLGVLYSAYRLGIPATIHITIGADIIHQHPRAYFAAYGAASGLDFQRFTASVCELEGGAFLNFGSAVTGPEVFLKALTIARNLGNPVSGLTTANFDLRALENYRSPLPESASDYYYRPRKNIVNRPTLRGGRGYHITGDHRETIPALHRSLCASGEAAAIRAAAASSRAGGNLAQAALPAEIAAILNELTARQPLLGAVVPELARAFREIAQCFQAGGTLFLAGNGGSMADALHLSAELLKSYAKERPLPLSLEAKLDGQPDGSLLKRNLQGGMRAVVLGANLSLSSAIANDMPDRDVNLAQELLALGKAGDVFLGISTSGKARNLCLAAQTAAALGLPVIALTGQGGGKLAALADIVLRVPAQVTARVQELHTQVYHTLCEMLEDETLRNL